MIVEGDFRISILYLDGDPATVAATLTEATRAVRNASRHALSGGAVRVTHRVGLAAVLPAGVTGARASSTMPTCSEPVPPKRCFPIG